MLSGWEDSVGATAEHAVACWAGKQVFYQEPQVAATVLKHAVKAIRDTMKEGLGKHERDSWLNEPYSNHSLKSARHMLTWTMQQDGNTPKDGEDHARLSLCRAAMTYAQKEEQHGN